MIRTLSGRFRPHSAFSRIIRLHSGNRSARARIGRIGALAGLTIATPFTAAFAEAPEIGHAPIALTAPAISTADTLPTLEDEMVSSGDEVSAEPFAKGTASYYGSELAGNRTATGERFDPAAMTAAHRTLPLGSMVRVSHGGKSVVVRINDRGPFHGNRIIDLSEAAARKIGLRRAGSGTVSLAYAN